MQKAPKPPLIFQLNHASNASTPLPSPGNFQLPWTATVSVHIWKGHPWTIRSWIGARCREGLKAPSRCLPSGFLSARRAYAETAGDFRWCPLVPPCHTKRSAEMQPWRWGAGLRELTGAVFCEAPKSGVPSRIIKNCTKEPQSLEVCRGFCNS